MASYLVRSVSRSRKRRAAPVDAGLDVWKRRSRGSPLAAAHQRGDIPRRRVATTIATLLLLAAGASVAGNAHALAACTAAQVSSQDPQCPTGTGPCNISKVLEIGDGCTLDFGTRVVTVLGSGEINVLSNTVSILAGSFTVAPGGRLEGRGNLSTPPRDRGGILTITTTGAFNVQRATYKGVVDVSGNTRGGTFIVNAGGSVTVSGDILANNLTVNGGNGAIYLHADGGDLTSGSTSTISVTGGDYSSGGSVDISASGRVDLGTSIIANGGDGGVVDITSGAESIVRGINATGGGDAGSGGEASVLAGTHVQVLGPIVLNGTGSPTNSGGGDGGYIDIEAGFGDVTISSPIMAESGAPDGGGGGVDVLARGSIVQGASAPLSVQGQGQSSDGGEIYLEAGLDITANGNLNASGGFGGSMIDLIAGRNIVVNGMVEVQGRDAGGFGGEATVIGGESGQGNVTLNSTIDVGGGLCGTINGCGLGGFIELSGCNVTVSGTGSVLARGAEGGDNLLAAREQLRIDGPVDATTTSGLTDGTNTFQHPSRLALQISVAPRPPATAQAMGTCTSASQTGCLMPCPVCGNGVVEFPETCDTSGTPVNCDGCSNFCRIQSCNDSNGCTTDSCDLTLGCRSQSVAEGASCSDGNVCNGVEACSAGLCRPTTPPLNCNDNNVCTADWCDLALGCRSQPVAEGASCSDGNVCNGAEACSAGLCGLGTPPLDCNDNNVCTTDSCHATLGCRNPPAPAGGACSDNNACTVSDTCNGAGACSPGAPRSCVDGLPCTTDSCNPASGCVFPPAPNGTACDDGAFCTVNDACQSAVCSGGPRDCNDSDSCTTDVCNESVDSCENTASGSCCGDETVNPGEQCDDGNTSNDDGCLDTCVLASCGDGFVRPGVEQCDAGAGNSGAPNAACRLDCTPQRCGDGIVDDQSSSTPEQCDDGGTTNGDDCSAGCLSERPATANLIPGRGGATSDCGLEWAYDQPALDRHGIPSIKQSCVDDDPACDMGTAPGECTFFVWVCANNTDARLPRCIPGAAGIGHVVSVETRKPSLREAGLRPEDGANRQQLLLAAAAAQTTAADFCGPRVAVRVPRKGADKKGVKVLKLAGTTSADNRDADVLKLFCLPPTP